MKINDIVPLIRTVMKPFKLTNKPFIRDLQLFLMNNAHNFKGEFFINNSKSIEDFNRIFIFLEGCVYVQKYLPSEENEKLLNDVLETLCLCEHKLTVLHLHKLTHTVVSTNYEFKNKKFSECLLRLLIKYKDKLTTE